MMFCIASDELIYQPPPVPEYWGLDSDVYHFGSKAFRGEEHLALYTGYVLLRGAENRMHKLRNKRYARPVKLTYHELIVMNCYFDFN